MAQASAASSYNMVGNREDLTDVVKNITPDKTPIFSNLGKTRAYARTHEWQTDALTTASDNAQIEGADYSFAIPGARTRLSNYTQIFSKTVEVSESQRAFSVAGIDDEYAYQLGKRLKEIATDVENALITATGNSGASGTARRMKGILSFIATNVTTGTGTGNESLTETMYNDNLQLIWAAGGNPDRTYVNAWQKRKISSFATSNTRYLEVTGEGELKNTIAVYESEFGRQRILLDNFMPTDKVLVLTSDLWKIAVARPIVQKDVVSIGDSKRGVVIGELTLEAQNEKGSGKITELATS